jgi:hypothetical protein
LNVGEQEATVANDSKSSRTQSRLEKAAREGENIRVHYEVEAKAIREKTARLRALRLAKEAADKETAVANTPVKPGKKKSASSPKKKSASLSEWQNAQRADGQRD